jgi:hypothetical protein
MIPQRTALVLCSLCSMVQWLSDHLLLCDCKLENIDNNLDCSYQFSLEDDRNYPMLQLEDHLLLSLPLK